MHPILKKKGFIIDLDGVIYKGETPIQSGIKAIRKLKKLNKKIIFVSNNSTRSRRTVLRKLKKLGLEVSKDEVLLATYATARFISKEKKNAKIFTTGEPGLIEELKLANLKIVDYNKAEYLVVGSNKKINFELMTKALRACLSGLRYISVNPDRFSPGSEGPVPGTGMIIGALYWMTGRKPDVIIGKPSKILIKEALEILNLRPKDVVVVGDQIDIDIAVGRKVGAKTLLVLTGVTTNSNLNKMKKRFKEKPDYVLNNLGDLFG